MARQKKNAHKVQMTEGKRNIVRQPLEEYHIETAQDIQDANADGYKEVLTIQVGENESAKYWLPVLNGLKNRGVKDILLICADSFTGIKEAISTAFPKTEYQRCIVFQVRNTLKYVSDKDRKPFATGLKTIYYAATEEAALETLERVTEKWTEKYPNPIKTGMRSAQSSSFS